MSSLGESSLSSILLRPGNLTDRATLREALADPEQAAELFPDDEERCATEHRGGGIYMLRSPKGEVYIGMTCTFYWRMMSHERQKKGNSKLICAKATAPLSSWSKLVLCQVLSRMSPSLCIADAP